MKLLARLVKGHIRAAISILDQRCVQARNIFEGAIAIFGEIGRIAAGTMIDNPPKRIAEVQADIIANAEVPVIAQVARGVCQTVVEALNAQVNACSAYLLFNAVQQEIAIGNVDIQRLAATGAGRTGQRVLDEGVKGKLPQTIIRRC